MNITARDMQDSLLRWLGGSSNEQSILDIRTAIDQALTELWGQHDWPWYISNYTFKTDASVTTGTIAYNAGTRRFTLSGGTWPEWVVYGTIKVGTKFARVESYISSTVIEIEENTQFTSNIAAGTSYELYRTDYPLPEGVRKVSYMANDDNIKHLVNYRPPLEFSRSSARVGVIPNIYTVMKDRRPGRGLNLCIWPYPRSSSTYRFPYMRAPSRVAVWSTTGKASVVEGDTTITGINTDFDDNMLDAVFRLGRDGKNEPTESAGLYPALQETMIQEVTSSTIATARDEFLYEKTGVTFVISSLIDIDIVTMRTVFERLCYVLLGEKRVIPGRDQQSMQAAYMRTLRDAKANSTPSSQITYAGQPGNRVAYTWFEIGGW